MAYEKFLRGSMRMLHLTGHNALQICGVQVDYTEDEYYAFCSGFAAVEYTGTLVRQRHFNPTMAVANTQLLLVETGDVAELEVAGRHQQWAETHPNTYGVVIDAGAARGETMKQLQARAIGAYFAGELWREW